MAICICFSSISSSLSSAFDLAERYKLDLSYGTDDKRVDALIRWETTKNFTAGFIAGLGGAITLPITIPGSVAASWLIQARMVGAIACIYGHDPRSDKVDPVVWVELIPFEETRTYVKRVLGNYVVYQARLGHPEIGIRQALRSIPH